VADDKGNGGDDLFEDLDKFFAPIRDVDWESEEPQAPEATPQEEHVAVHVPEAAPLEGEPTQVPLGDAAVDDGEDESWYDTSALEPIDELLGEPAEGSVGNEVPAADADQGGLFDTGADDASDDDGALEDDRAPTEQEIEAAAEHFAGSVTVADELEEGPIDRKAIDTIRTLSMDAVQAANSGHPGTAMAMAPVGYTLWQNVLRFDPEDPTRYDFSLCHMGMVQRCPSRPEAARCEGCGVRPVCVHWQRSKKTSLTA
jgi:hypothetical protein